MYYTAADFMRMSEADLIAIWENGIYLNPDEMEAYMDVLERREIEI